MRRKRPRRICCSRWRTCPAQRSRSWAPARVDWTCNAYRHDPPHFTAGPKNRTRPTLDNVGRVLLCRPAEAFMKPTLLALACVAICGSVFTTAAQTKQPCTPSGGLSFVCGVENAEDLVVVPNSRWMVASGMAPGSGLHLVDTQAKSVRKLY